MGSCCWRCGAPKVAKALGKLCSIERELDCWLGGGERHIRFHFHFSKTRRRKLFRPGGFFALLRLPACANARAKLSGRKKQTRTNITAQKRWCLMRDGWRWRHIRETTRFIDFHVLLLLVSWHSRSFLAFLAAGISE